jgi:hypothetical protein
MKPVRDDGPVKIGGKTLSLEERVARLERLNGLGPPERDCTLCKGTGKVRWGRPDRMGGEEGPCACVLPAWRRRP